MIGDNLFIAAIILFPSRGILELPELFRFAFASAGIHLAFKYTFREV